MIWFRLILIVYLIGIVIFYIINYSNIIKKYNGKFPITDYVTDKEISLCFRWALIWPIQLIQARRMQ